MRRLRAIRIGGACIGILCGGVVAGQERLVPPPGSTTPAVQRLSGQRSSGPELDVLIAYRTVISPALVRGLVRVAPHPDNRTLRVEVDSPAFYRSSEVELDGERSAKSHFFAWPSLPAGAYAVTATVLGPGGHPRAARRVALDVLGPGAEPAFARQ